MSDSSPKIAIIGAGYVGLTSATLFAQAGYNVTLVEVSKEKVETILGGKSPFYEPGLDALIKEVVEDKKMSATTDYMKAIPEADVVFLCVGTPDNPDGSSNLSYIFQAVETAAPLAKDGVLFVQKSTVPVGTGKEMSELIKKTAPALQCKYISNPEFLREGTAIFDTVYADRVVLGGDDKSALEVVARIYRAVEANTEITGLEKPKQPITTNYLLTTLPSAELIKVTANAFLALKISFANSIAKLCDEVGANVSEVMDGVGQDKRIGRAFLNAGRGYGGGCFPKDVSGLISSAAKHGVSMEIMDAATVVNSSMPQYVIEQLTEKLGDNLQDKNVAVYGLSFKAGTSDTRRSPAIVLANMLADAGANVSAYDPKAIVEEEIRDTVLRKETPEAAAENADALVIATEWPEFSSLDFAKLKSKMRGDVLMDAMNIITPSTAEKSGLTYQGVGR